MSRDLCDHDIDDGGAGRAAETPARRVQRVRWALSQAEHHGFGEPPARVAAGAMWLYDEIRRAREWLVAQGGSAALSRPQLAHPPRASATPAPALDGIAFDAAGPYGPNFDAE